MVIEKPNFAGPKRPKPYKRGLNDIDRKSNFMRPGRTEDSTAIPAKGGNYHG
jgi:hypothetical protein